MESDVSRTATAAMVEFVTDTRGNAAASQVGLEASVMLVRWFISLF